MKLTLIILLSIIIGILLFPLFIVLTINKKFDWKIIIGIYKDWFIS